MNDETIQPDNTTNDPTSVDIDLDWGAYFNTFCNAHGKYPVVYGKEDQLLLFPDGWMYSAVSYEGPEHEPPTDERELYQLLLYYWGRRYRIVKLERDDLKHRLTVLKDVQRTKSQPLYQTVEYTNESGKTITESKTLDLSMMEKRIQWLDNDVKNCKMMIEQYNKKLVSFSGNNQSIVPFQGNK